MDSRRLIPSMFHRRLVLLLVVIGLVLSLCFAQLYRLSVVEGAARLAEAESRLDRREYLPTYRGRILDRHGRVLATDRASYDIAVDYEVVTGSWERRQAARQARQELGRNTWQAMSPEQRADAISERMDRWTQQTDVIWKAVEVYGDLDPEEVLARRDAIKAEVQQMAAVVWDRQQIEWQMRFGTEDEADDGFRPRPIREQRQPHVILPRVSDEVAFEFRRLARDFEGVVHVLDSRRREYPWQRASVVVDRSSLPGPLASDEPATLRVEGVADHVLGSVRDEVWAQDVRRRPFVDPRTGEIDLGGYRVGDNVGSRGLEAVFEDHLRGLRGVIHERRDTGEQRRTDPVPGSDLQIAMDIMLQARVQAILSHDLGLTRVQSWHNNDVLPRGTPLNASTVVMEVGTGDVLAMVSMPTISMGREMDEAERRRNDPWVNRAAEAIYPPGSILKPLVLTAAVQEGRYQLGQTIECRGHYYEHLPDRARCWIYRDHFHFRTHGPLGPEEAMARSCNVFFYTLGDRLGLARLADWLGRFGLGSPLDVGLLEARDGDRTVFRGESGGNLPDDELIARLRGRGELDFASVIMGIGQGPVTWTPLQAANAYATLARGGIVRDATLVRDEDRLRPREAREHLGLSPSLVRAALEGLRQSVEESHGTGYHIRFEDGSDRPPHRIFNAPDVTVWAKTGTAQAPALVLDTTGDGQIDQTLTGLSHAWVVGLVGPEGSGEPTHAFAVIVEYGGSGGRVAGPIANEIVRALQAEGYLPGGDQLAAYGEEREPAGGAS